MSLIPESWDNISLKRQQGDSGGSRDTGAKKRRKRMNTAATVFAEEGSRSGEKSPALQGMVSTSEGISKSSIVDEHLNTQKESVLDKLSSTIKMSIDNDERSKNIQMVVEQVNLNLEKIVSMSNYKKILRGIDSSSLFFTNDIKAVSKKYEDMFLRQAMSKNERSCVQGQNCECMFLDQSQPFVGVEYRLPWENEKGETPGLCLVCSRAATQLLFFDLLQSRDKINGVIQRWYA